MTEEIAKNNAAKTKDQRAERLAAQLRTNLRKRKDQARQMNVDDADAKPPPEPA